MTSKERLMRTLRGESVDRVPVCFYELNGYDEDRSSCDEFNIFNHPSWYPLIDLTKEQSDSIIMRSIPFEDENPSLDERIISESWYDDRGSLHTKTQIRADDRILTSHTRRDLDINTIWTLEHFVKDSDDLQAYLSLPESDSAGEPDFMPFYEAEKMVGENGIVMIDSADAICEVAALCSMSDGVILAMCEQELFVRALERFSRILERRTKRICDELPGRLWRIYGPEYATKPYLPLELFKRYVGGYDDKLIQLIQSSGGYARIHSHGNISEIMPSVAKMGWDAIDPLEPAPQGDVELEAIRREYGKHMVLFGNIELSEIESMPAAQFEKRVYQALEDGTSGEGRGFVLMPTACPIGRILKPETLRNYEIMIEAVNKF